MVQSTIYTLQVYPLAIREQLSPQIKRFTRKHLQTDERIVMRNLN